MSFQVFMAWNDISIFRKLMRVMKKTVFIICCLVTLLSSCTTLQLLSYERLQAGNVSFPEQIRRVGVVNNVPESVEVEKGIWEGEGKIASETLAQEIAGTRYFDQVVIADSVSLPTDSLFQALGVDALLVFERIQIELKESELFLPESMAIVPAVDGIVTSVVKAYIPTRTVPLFTVSKSDTLSWAVNPSLTFGQVVKEASEYAAYMPMDNILPHWKEMNRYYFDGGDADMRDAGVCVREQDWETAATLWQKVYNRTSGKKKMRAAYNLALYSEMKDDFARAEEYLTVAASLVEEASWEGQLIRFYQQNLKEQAVEFRQLKIQMSRFE